MDAIVEIFFYGSFVLPAIVFLYVLLRLQSLSCFKRVIVGGLFGCAAFVTSMILAVSIFMRDGLGPDTVISYGIDALVNCWDGVVLAFVLGAVFVVPGIILATYKRENVKRSRLIMKGVICFYLTIGTSWIIKEVLYQRIIDSDLRPNVFSTTFPKYLFDSGSRFDLDAREALVISNWITSNQSGWKFESDGDFDPPKTEFSADNYSVQVDKNKILIQYYKSEADLTNDGGDSYFNIKRPLTASDQAFWATQVNQVKTDQKVEVKLP